MSCYEYKGGNGTASRMVGYGNKTFTVAAFVQANFGSRAELTIAGRHIGPALLDDNPLDGDWFEVDLGLKPPASNLAPETVTVGYRRYRTRHAIYAACGVLALGGALWIGGNLYQMYGYKGEKEQAAGQTRHDLSDGIVRQIR